MGHWERERFKEIEAVLAVGFLLPAAGIAAVGIGAGLAGYALYQWLSDSPFQPISEYLNRDVWTPEAREQFSEENPSLLEQALGGPGLFWKMLFP